MKLWAAEVIAVRPTEGDPSLIWREPAGEKNEATFDAFWLHQAAVYRVAKLFSSVNCMAVLCDVHAVRETVEGSDRHMRPAA